MDIRRKLGFSLVALLVAVGLLEGLCRVLAPSGGLMQGALEPTEGDAQAIYMRGSPFLLWELAPGDRQGPGGAVSINADGFRDQSRGAKSGPRVLALGDSSVYGFGVGDPDVFTAKLEVAIPGTEFINGGVPGYSSTQALNLLWGRGLALEPDLVLAMTLWSDNNFDTFVDADQIATYAAWRRSGVASVEAVLEHSAIYRALEYAMRKRTPGRVGWDGAQAADAQRQPPRAHRAVRPQPQGVLHDPGGTGRWGGLCDAAQPKRPHAEGSKPPVGAVPAGDARGRDELPSTGGRSAEGLRSRRAASF